MLGTRVLGTPMLGTPMLGTPMLGTPISHLGVESGVESGTHPSGESGQR